MYSRLFTQADDFLQPVILIQSKGDGDLIQAAHRQDHHEIRDASQNLYTFVGGSGWDIIIQNSPYHITPLRILQDPVYIFLCRAAVPDQKNLFLVQTAAPHIHQHIEYDHPGCPFQYGIYKIKDKKGKSGIIVFVNHIENCYDDQKPQCVGFQHIAEHQSFSLHPEGCVKIKCLIHEQISGNDKDQQKHKFPEALGFDRGVRKGSPEPAPPGADIGKRDQDCIDQYMETAEAFLIFYDQFLLPLSPEKTLL